MANENSKILTAEKEKQLRQPIEDYVGKIQKKIDSLREEGTDRVLTLQNDIDGIKRDRVLTKSESEAAIAECRNKLEKAKEIEAKHKDEIEKLISEAINKGEFSILGDERLHDLTIQRLEELGYQVQSGCHYNEPYYSVKWE